MEEMWLFGKCPQCNCNNVLLVGKSPRAVCERCNHEWPEWIQLCRDQRKIGNPLIPVEVVANPMTVHLVWPSADNIACERLIRIVLNVAIMVRFKLTTDFSTEGGIEGLVGRHYVELRNIDDNIGLIVGESYMADSPTVQKVLRWYSKLLRLLITEELVVSRHSLGRGTILKLSPTDSAYTQKCLSLLAMVLLKMRTIEKKTSWPFVREVFGEVEKRTQSFGGAYIAGLTPQQVLAFFVQPPLTPEVIH